MPRIIQAYKLLHERHKDTVFNKRPIPMRFYCHWLLPGDSIQYDKNGAELVDDKQKMCCFNHRVGLPTRKWEGDLENPENIPVELTHFNRRMMEYYHKHRKYSMNKCRGSGASEILTIRYMVYKYGVLNKVKDRKCMIMPGTSQKLSHELSTRIKSVCDRIPQIYKKMPTSLHPDTFEFVTSGKIMLTSATADAIRGWENVGDIILEEVAHWDMVDDMPVYMSSQAVHTKTQCHVVHSTTPRQKRGFYYNLVWDDTAKSDFYRHVTNWREIVGIPIVNIEDMQEYIRVHGKIEQDTIDKLRLELKEMYLTDMEYKEWFDDFFNGIPFDEIVDVPIGLLDINSIVRDSITFRPEYDQELDNKFISTNNRAIGEFMIEDFDVMDLEKDIETFDNALHLHKNPDIDLLL